MSGSKNCINGDLHLYDFTGSLCDTFGIEDHQIKVAINVQPILGLWIIWVCKSDHPLVILLSH
jgi:hypothetical protein